MDELRGSPGAEEQMLSYIESHPEADSGDILLCAIDELNLLLNGPDIVLEDG